MKKIVLVLSFVMVAFIMMSNSGCEQTPSSDEVLNQKQEQLMKQANNQVGMPNITRFTQRKQLKMIQELCDQENLVCYAYIVPEMTGKPVFLGKCIGFGIPYATEYTSPQKVERHSERGYITMPQADPDGLFKPASADGTWLMMIDPETGDVRPIYCEPKVLVSPFPLNSSDGANYKSKNK